MNDFKEFTIPKSVINKEIYFEKPETHSRVYATSEDGLELIKACLKNKTGLGLDPDGVITVYSNWAD